MSINLAAFNFTIPESIQNAADAVKDKAEEVTDYAKDATEQVKEKANQISDDAKDKAEQIKDQANQVSEQAKEKAEEVKVQVKEKAEQTVANVKDKAVQAKEKAVEIYHSIDMQQFQQGWDHAVDFASSTFSSYMGSQYVTDVGNAINDLKASMNSAKGSNRGLAQEAGFAAERWTAGTFNVDAIAGGSSYRANVVGSNGLGSVDVSTNYGKNASLKYYKDAKGSAKAQATDILERYSEYKSSSKNPKTLDEYINENNLDKDELYKSIYEGQTRIIPTDQLKDAKDYLKGKKNTKPDFTKTSKQDAKQRTRSYNETLKKLKDRLEAPDGTKSTPMTYDEMQAIAELCQNGDFKPEDFGITTSQIITPKYIVKQSINAGLSSAALNAVLTVGPDVFTILKVAAKEGKIDEEELKRIGVEGIIAGSEGFVEGSVSCAILTACQAGKLGANLTNASPEVVGALTVILIDSIRYGYSLSKGEITTLDYSNLMADEILITVVSIGSGMALKTLLPAIPFAYMVGSMAGSMLATAGLGIAKEIIMEVKDGGGFEVIVPTGKVNAMSVITDKITNLNIYQELSAFKDTVVTTANDGYIYVSSVLT